MIDSLEDEVFNKAWENVYAGYFQDRWKPRPNISIKAGFRIDSNRIYTRDREKVLKPMLPAGRDVSSGPGRPGGRDGSRSAGRAPGRSAVPRRSTWRWI